MKLSYLTEALNTNLLNIDNEIEARLEKYNELKNLSYDVDEHYINRFRYDLALINDMIKKLEAETDIDKATKLIDEIDFRIKHAEGYIGLPG